MNCELLITLECARSSVECDKLSAVCKHQAEKMLRKFKARDYEGFVSGSHDAKIPHAHVNIAEVFKLPRGLKYVIGSLLFLYSSCVSISSSD